MTLLDSLYSEGLNRIEEYKVDMARSLRLSSLRGRNDAN